MPYLVQVKTTPLRSPSLTAPPTAAARWGTRGERETTPPARPQAPEGHPGTLQGHQPKAKAKERTHAQRQRRVRRDGRDAPLPVAGRGGPRDAAGKAQRGVSAASQRPTAARTPPRSGRVPHPFPFHTPPSGKEGKRRGARGQSEKSGPIRQGMSVPRLARLRPGPGERDVTTSIKRRGQTSTEERRENEAQTASRSETGLAALSLATQSPSSFSSFLFFSGTQGHRVHTNLVLQNANFRQSMDAPGGRGVCLHITPASRKGITATGDPTGPHRHQRRAGGGG